MDELTLTYNAEKMELTIFPIWGSRLHNITEVVRCKDCNHWEEHDGDHFCSCWANLMTDTAPDDFCSYGERKDNE